MPAYTMGNHGLSERGGGISTKRLVNRVDHSKTKALKKLREELLQLISENKLRRALVMLSRSLRNRIINPEQADVFFQKNFPISWQ